MRQGPLWLVFALSLAISGVGVGQMVDAHLRDAGSVPAALAVSPAVPPAERRAEPPAVSSPPPVAEPTRLSLPALGVDAPVVGVTVGTDGQLGVPDNPAVLGWWRGGAWPAAPRGTVVLDGHVDTREAGPGALFRIASVSPGATVSLRTADGAANYVVQAVRHYPKSALPAEVFDTTGNPRLVLISCGGAFDHATRQYKDNVVVYATPATAATPA
ncbi:class F sortase [Pseudonocardia acaciae]|uniref:class F sortase n=1 Tax=Pseudonocardia acaciae TaxID=551276 RepID=UPI0012EED49C|nr:class F sortase [Pseudonocardia acaciae]